MHDYILDLLIFLIAAVVVVPIFRMLKLGAILAYLFAGILIGPQVLKLIKDPQVILSFSELGIVLLLFIIGLELNPKRLWRMKNEVFGMGLLQVLMTGSIFTFIATGIGLNFSSSVLIGFGLALSSTAFGIQILQENRQLKTIHGQGSFAILLFQDLAVVPLIALVPLLSAQELHGPSYLEILKSVGAIVIVMLIGPYIVRWWFRQVAESRVQEVFTATSLLIVLGTAVLMEHAGLSMGMGAFLAGMMLANSEYRHEVESDLQPFKGLLMGLFFIAIGMSLDLSIIVKYPHYVIAIVLAFMSIKSVVIYGLGRLFKLSSEAARNMACILPQGGEFAFVLFATASAANLLDNTTSSLLNASVTISMALTPLFFGINQKYKRTYSEISERPPEEINPKESKVIIVGYGRFGQIAARFLKSMDLEPVVLEHSAIRVDAARKFGTKIYYGDATRAEILESAGGKDAAYIILAIHNIETSVAAAVMIQKHFPNLKIIARAHNRQHAIALMEVGVTNIHRETFLSSLEAAKEVLLKMGEEPNQINQHLQKFRTSDEEILRKQFEWRNDEKQFIRFTNDANLELETILKEDRANLIAKRSIEKNN